MDSPFNVDEDSLLDDPENNRAIVSPTPEEIVIKDSDTLLVETVYNFPALYNKELKEYHDSELRKNCWQNISAVLNRQVPDCQKRWAQLRDSFTSERRRRVKDARSGSGQTKRKGFALYESMAYLHQHIKHKKTFTNVLPAPLMHPSTINTQRYVEPPAKRSLPTILSTMSFAANKATADMSRTYFPPTTDSLFLFPPTPPSNTSTPPPAMSPELDSSLTQKPSPATSPELDFSLTQKPSRAPSTSTHSLQVSTCHSATPVVPDTISSESLPNAIEGPSVSNEVQYTEPFVKSGSSSFNIPASSRPPQAPTPTAHNSRLSPGSPYSTFSDTSYSLDDSPQFPLSSPTSLTQKLSHTEQRFATPKKCYNKDSRMSKKVDPVEKSFLTLSAALQDHFTQKSTGKETKASKSATHNSEEAFGLLIATELQKLDEDAKKNKKTRILQILYD